MTFRKKIYKLALNELRSSQLPTPTVHENRTVQKNPNESSLSPEDQRFYEEQDIRKFNPQTDILPEDLEGMLPTKAGQMSVSRVIYPTKYENGVATKTSKPIFIKRFKDTHFTGSNGEREIANEKATRHLAHIFDVDLPEMNLLRENEDPNDRTKNYKIMYTKAITDAKPLGLHEPIANMYNYVDRYKKAHNGKLPDNFHEVEANTYKDVFSKIDPRNLISTALFTHFFNVGDRNVFNLLISNDGRVIHSIDHSLAFAPQTDWEKGVWQKSNPILNYFIKDREYANVDVPKDLLKKIIDSKREVYNTINSTVLPHYSRDKRHEIRTKLKKDFDTLNKIYNLKHPKVSHLKYLMTDKSLSAHDIGETKTTK